MNIKVFEELVSTAKDIARLGQLMDAPAHKLWCAIEAAEAELKKLDELDGLEPIKPFVINKMWETVNIPKGYSMAQIELDSQDTHRIHIEILKGD